MPRFLRSSLVSSCKDCKKAVRSFAARDKWWVLDIGGNNLRLVAFIEFRDQRVYVKYIVPLAEYDKLCKRYRKADNAG